MDIRTTCIGILVGLGHNHVEVIKEEREEDSVCTLNSSFPQLRSLHRVYRTVKLLKS